jgi:ureidoglycolate hydrolase
MDEEMLEIREHIGEGYKALVDYGAWRVAILRNLDDLQPDHINEMERHIETDKVFVLIEGSDVLLIGGNSAQVDGVYPQVMEKGKIYNVKRNVWHPIFLNRDAGVVLVENRDTSTLNSEYTSLTRKQRHLILEQAHLIISPSNGEE